MEARRSHIPNHMHLLVLFLAACAVVLSPILAAGARTAGSSALLITPSAAAASSATYQVNKEGAEIISSDQIPEHPPPHQAPAAGALYFTGPLAPWLSAGMVWYITSL